jgi:hypothetical protein
VQSLEKQGGGHRCTAQLLRVKQPEAMRGGLPPLGVPLELLERATNRAAK